MKLFVIAFLLLLCHTNTVLAANFVDISPYYTTMINTDEIVYFRQEFPSIKAAMNATSTGFYDDRDALVIVFKNKAKLTILLHSEDLTKAYKELKNVVEKKK